MPSKKEKDAKKAAAKAKKAAEKAAASVEVLTTEVTVREGLHGDVAMCCCHECTSRAASTLLALASSPTTPSMLTVGGRDRHD